MKLLLICCDDVKPDPGPEISIRSFLVAAI